MSQELKPLPSGNESVSVRIRMGRLSEQIRLRLREEMARLEMSQRDVAGILGWSQSHVAHILNGRVALTVDDLAEFAFGLNLSIVEAVRDRGMEFCAELTPSELRFLEIYRSLSQPNRDAIAQILTGHSTLVTEQRRAAPGKPKRGPRLR